MNIVEVRKIVGQLKAQLFKKSNSYSIGMLKSHFRGSGLQFKEHRQYTHGDDVRFIDWKLLAKTGDPYLKTFEEERNVHIAVVLDLGPSMFYGWNGTSKIQAALEIVCLLYLIAAETNDFVHVILLSDKVTDVPVGSGEKGLAQFIAYLSRIGLIDEKGKLNYEFANNGISLEERNKEIKKHLARNREVIILSDWLDFLTEDSFKKVTHNKNAHCFRILAPLDYAKTRPISLLSRGTLGGSSVKVVNSKENDIPSFGGRIKDLKVEDRYLDQFIREMI